MAHANTDSLAQRRAAIAIQRLSLDEQQAAQVLVLEKQRLEAVKQLQQTGKALTADERRRRMEQIQQQYEEQLRALLRPGQVILLQETSRQVADSGRRRLGNQGLPIKEQ